MEGNNFAITPRALFFAESQESSAPNAYSGLNIYDDHKKWVDLGDCDLDDFLRPLYYKDAADGVWKLKMMTLREAICRRHSHELAFQWDTDARNKRIDDIKHKAYLEELLNESRERAEMAYEDSAV